MQEAQDAVVFNGMTADELARAYDVFSTLPNPQAYMQETNELHAAAVARCPPLEKDIAYGDTPIEKLDIYASAAASGSPVLIDVHGGGFTLGTKNTRAIPAPGLVSRGVIWVPIDYGLAPAHRIDEIAAHVRRAIAWVYTNIGAYGGDPHRLFVSGNSAGACLAGMALMPGWQREHALPDDAIKGACLMSGIFDLEPVVLAAQGPNEALKMTLADAARLSPLRHLPARGCPIVVSYGAPELPAFVQQSSNFARAWRDAGFPVETVVVPGAHHMAMSRELANVGGTLFKVVCRMLGI